MPEALAPRPYQTEAIDALLNGWQGSHNRLAVVLPTGSGKTVVFSHLALKLAQAGHRSLILAHREELIGQAAAKIRAVAPHLRVGIVKAAKNQHQDVDVIVASTQTLAVEKRRNDITGVGLVIVDEAHHYAAATYREVLDHFGCFRIMPTAGFSATLARQDGGLGDVWQEVVYKRDILQMIRDRYLVDVRGKRVVVDGLALDDVKSRGGDFQDGQLGQALDDAGAAQVVADAYLEHAADRSGLIFTPTVATAQHMAEVMTANGIPTEAVWGGMSKDERAAVLERFRKGDTQVLANCMILTEGYDAPWASCAVIARPTRSAPLYIQMVGRVLRTWPGKTDALVLDVTGASTRHQLASLVDLSDAEIGTVQDGETLTEAADRALDGEPDTGLLRPGSIQWQDVDLFHGSKLTWLSTYGGTPFLAVADAEYFLVPGEYPEMFRIRRWKKGEGITAAPNDMDLPLEYAMSWAEKYAEHHAGALVNRSAGWRNRAASEAQLDTCRRNRIPVQRGATAGEVSNALAVHFASTRIDRYATACSVSAA
jgi:superfamily II DNA or RNA helicase